MFILIVYLILAVFGCFEGVAGSARIFFGILEDFFLGALVNKEKERQQTTAWTHERQQQRDGQQQPQWTFFI